MILSSLLVWIPFISGSWAHPPSLAEDLRPKILADFEKTLQSVPSGTQLCDRWNPEEVKYQDFKSALEESENKRSFWFDWIEPLKNIKSSDIQIKSLGKNGGKLNYGISVVMVNSHPKFILKKDDCKNVAASWKLSQTAIADPQCTLKILHSKSFNQSDIPHLARVLAVHRDIDQCEQLMELAPGMKAVDYVKEGSNSDYQKIGEKLGILHQLGIRHGDLHRANFFYEPKSQILTLIDYELLTLKNFNENDRKEDLKKILIEPDIPHKLFLATLNHTLKKSEELHSDLKKMVLKKDPSFSPKILIQADQDLSKEIFLIKGYLKMLPQEDQIQLAHWISERYRGELAPIENFLRDLPSSSKLSSSEITEFFQIYPSVKSLTDESKLLSTPSTKSVRKLASQDPIEVTPSGVTPSGIANEEPWKNVKKIVLIILENTSFSDALKQPALKRFAHKGALLAHYAAISHPSQPNYLALISGSTQDVSDDENHTLSAHHLGDLLEKAGKTWKVYAENYPGNCFLEPSQGRYVRKHVPFLSFENIQKDPKRCQSIVSADQWVQDFQGQTLPDFSLYIPNQDNNGHDTNVTYADHWFASTIEPLLEHSEMAKNTLFIITFDEGMTADNSIYTALSGPGIKVGKVSKKPYHHFNLLRTLELIFDLPSLNANDDSAKPILDIWER